MKKLFAVLFIGGFIAASVFAGTAGTGDSLTINGQVAQKLTATLSEETVAFTIGALGAPVDSQNVTLTVISNRKNWTLTFTSQNNGYLSNATALAGLDAGTTLDLETKIPYTVKVVDPTTGFGAGTTFSNNLLSGSAGVQLTSGKTFAALGNARTAAAGAGITMTIAIDNVDAGSLLWSSEYNYTDTLTVAIAAN